MRNQAMDFSEAFLGQRLEFDPDFYYRRYQALELIIAQCQNNLSEQFWWTYAAIGGIVVGLGYDAPMFSPDGGGGGGGSRGKVGGGSDDGSEPPPIKAPSSLSVEEISGTLRDVANKKGNFGVGSYTKAQADELGHAWVGDGATLGSSGKAWISRDGYKQYRPATSKKLSEKGYGSNISALVCPSRRLIPASQERKKHFFAGFLRYERLFRQLLRIAFNSVSVFSSRFFRSIVSPCS